MGINLRVFQGEGGEHLRTSMYERFLQVKKQSLPIYQQMRYSKLCEQLRHFKSRVVQTTRVAIKLLGIYCEKEWGSTHGIHWPRESIWWVPQKVLLWPIIIYIIFNLFNFNFYFFYNDDIELMSNGKTCSNDTHIVSLSLLETEA